MSEASSTRRPDFGLNERQTKFCLFFLSTFNAPLAAKKAGYCKKNASRLMRNPKIARAIAEMKRKGPYHRPVSARDVINMYAKIAFADVFDYVAADEKGRLRIRQDPDGLVVEEIASTQYGVRLKLCDRMKALEKLERHLNVLPDDWRREIELRRLQLAEQAKCQNVHVHFEMPEPESGETGESEAGE